MTSVSGTVATHGVIPEGSPLDRQVAEMGVACSPVGGGGGPEPREPRAITGEATAARRPRAAALPGPGEAGPTGGAGSLVWGQRACREGARD